MDKYKGTWRNNLGEWYRIEPRLKPQVLWRLSTMEQKVRTKDSDLVKTFKVKGKYKTASRYAKSRPEDVFQSL